MSVEIINARSEPTIGGPPSYYEKSRTYNRSAETKAKQDLFCEGYIHKGTLTGAAKYAKIAVSNHFRWLDVDPDYPKRFEVAKLTAQELLVEEGRRRALEGVEEPTGWYRGEPGGFVKRYSDSLLIFLIKGAFPDIYKDRHEHTGKNGGPIEVQSTVTIEQFPVWLKQAIVVCSTGISIDPEVEKILQAHFEAKFLEAEKVVGNGTTSGQGEAKRLGSYQPDAESYHGELIEAEGRVVEVRDSRVEATVGQVVESVVEMKQNETEDSLEASSEISLGQIEPQPNYRSNDKKKAPKTSSGLSLDDI